MKYLILIIFVVILYVQKPMTLNDVQFLKPSKMSIEVKGHLNNPGIFEITSYSNFQDLLKELELFEDSDYDHISLSKQLEHRDIIVIKQKQEVSKISINSASLEELITLKGIGEATANRIIQYRENESFKTIEDLKNVKGIGEKIFQNIKDSIIL